MTTETKTKPEKGHLVTACKAIQREIDKKQTRVKELHEKSLYLEHEASVLREEIQGLEEHIKKLKGE